MKKSSRTPSKFTLYSIGIGAIVFCGTIVSMKHKLFPEPLAPCTQRYQAGIDFPGRQAGTQPIGIRDVQTRLGFDEWGLVENVSISALSGGSYGHALQVTIPKGSSGGQDGAKQGGVSYSWKPGIKGGATAACLSYAVRMPDGFNFHQGGVLPGLFGGENPREGRQGFGARIGWRQGGLGDVLLNSPATTEKGAYLMPGAWTFPKGRWVNIEQEIRLNRAGLADGVMAIWIDGVLRAELKQVGYRAQDSVRIEGIVSDVHFTQPSPEQTQIQLTNFNLRWR